MCAPVQAVASAILAPSLRHVADSLSLSWRRQLTAVAHQRYLARINFYTTSQLAGMQVRAPSRHTLGLSLRHSARPLGLSMSQMPAKHAADEHWLRTARLPLGVCVLCQVVASGCALLVNSA